MTEELNAGDFLLVCGTRFVFLSNLTSRGNLPCRSPLNFAQLLQEKGGRALNISINTP